MEYDAIIIGAGIGGLSCALKLSFAGKLVLLLERQPVVGGCATTFSRKGFTFESSMHCVNSLAKGGELRGFLEELGVDKKVEFIELENFCRIFYPEYDFTVDFNKEHFIGFLEKNFPDEKDNLKKLFRELDKFYKQFDNFCMSELPDLIQLILSPFFYQLVIKVSSLTTEDFLSKYLKNEKLKSVFTDLWRFLGVPPSELSALYFLIILRGYYFEKTCYVKGGYMQLFKAIAEKIKENGSRVLTNTPVKKIITENRKAIGVITEKGEEFFARTVISNANAVETLTELVGDEAAKKEYQNNLEKLQKSISVFQVYLGLNTEPKKLGMNNFMFSINTAYDHDKSFKYNIDADYDNCLIELVDHSQIDSSLAPQGKGTLLIMTFDTYEHWKDLTEDQYREKKKIIAQKLIERSEKYLPGLSKSIEVMEIATPKTMYRYTLAPQGAIYGFAHTVMQSGIFRLSQKTKINGLFLAGSWTRPGAGIHGCFISGLDAAKLALKFLG